MLYRYFLNMTKIGEEYSLSSINVKKFFMLPISIGRNNCFYVNDGRNSVVKVQDRKMLHSWTLNHPNTFTCPVVVVADDDGTVYGVMNCDTLLRWSIEDDTLKDAEKFRLKESVFAVLPICGKQPIVLFNSGRVLQTENLPCTERTGTCFISQAEEIIWADATCFQSKIIVVCLSVSKKDKTHLLHSFSVDENNVSSYINQMLVQGFSVLKSWCLNKSTSTFFSMWSSGLIQCHQICSSKRSTLLTIPGIQDWHLLEIDCVDPHHIALVKCNPKQKELILEIWDVQYKVLKARKPLRSVSPSSIQLFATESIIFMSYNEELIELSIEVGKSTLAAAMGRSAMTTSKVREFSWKKGKLIQFDEQCTVEKMDTSETENTLSPTERIAQRLMEEGTDYLSYIPEAELIKLLRLAIRYKATASTDKCLRVKIEPDVILGAIFSSSFSDVFLLKHMKILNLEDAIIILKTLLSILNNKSTVSASCAKPSDLQVFTWICIILKSHTDAFLLSKDQKCIQLMKKIDQCLSEKLTEYEDCESIKSMISTIQRKKNILPEKYVDSRYCIETIDT